MAEDGDHPEADRNGPGSGDDAGYHEPSAAGDSADSAHHDPAEDAGPDDAEDAGPDAADDESEEGPRSGRLVRVLVVLAAGVVLLVVASLLARLGSSSSGSGSGSAGSSPSARPSAGTTTRAVPSAAASAESASVATCGTTPLGYATASVVITNQGPVRSSYLVTVSFRGVDGSEVTSATTAVEGLAPGRRSAPQQANSIDMTTRSFTCHVAEVSRYSP